MELFGAPMVSMKRYGVLGSGMTVGAYLAAVAALRAAACVIVAYITTVVSFAAKKAIPTLFFTTAVTLVPYVLVYMRVDAAKYIDITAMFSGSGLLLRSAGLSLFGSAQVFTLLIFCGYAALVAAALLAWRRAVGK